MVKAVIFDWAGVLAVDGYWEWLYANVPGSKENRAPFQKLSEEVDSASISHDMFMQKLADASGKPVDQIWREVKTSIVLNTELITYIQELKNKYRIALLSNFTHTWLKEVLDDNTLWWLFDCHIISSEHGMIKPTPQIFHKMLDMLNVAPNEAVFVDDRQNNVDAAKALGIRGLLYTDLASLKKDLIESGVET